MRPLTFYRHVLADYLIAKTDSLRTAYGEPDPHRLRESRSWWSPYFAQEHLPLFGCKWSEPSFKHGAFILSTECPKRNAKALKARR